MQKIYKITINDLTIEVIQDNDGKFIKPSIIDDYNSFGTALKPAYEPIIVARKPLKGTVAQNVMQYGVGGINIDECRVGTEIMKAQISGKTSRAFQSEEHTTAGGKGQDQIGRFPANMILGYLEDEYLLKDNISKQDKKKVLEWLSENT